jgi:hypothetical protein
MFEPINDELSPEQPHENHVMLARTITAAEK